MQKIIEKTNNAVKEIYENVKKSRRALSDYYELITMINRVKLKSIDAELTITIDQDGDEFELDFNNDDTNHFNLYDSNKDECEKDDQDSLYELILNNIIKTELEEIKQTYKCDNTSDLLDKCKKEENIRKEWCILPKRLKETIEELNNLNIKSVRFDPGVHNYFLYYEHSINSFDFYFDLESDTLTTTYFENEEDVEKIVGILNKHELTDNEYKSIMPYLFFIKREFLKIPENLKGLIKLLMGFDTNDYPKPEISHRLKYKKLSEPEKIVWICDKFATYDYPDLARSYSEETIKEMTDILNDCEMTEEDAEFISKYLS